MKRNEGFTLVELIVSIAIASLIMMAATSTMLLGLRINAQTTKNIQSQNATDMLMQVLQRAAEETITIYEDKVNDKVVKTTIKIPDNSEFIVYNHGTPELLLNGSVFMKEVTDFEAVLSENNSLLTVTIETNGKKYTSSVYCRLNPTPPPTPDEGGGNGEP